MDRASAAAVTLSCLLAGCNDADPFNLRPSPILVERIEAQLSGRPCIGALERWERHYGYGMGGDYLSADKGVERDRVTFALVEAGVYGFQSRRLILSAREWRLGTDMRQMRFAFGDYDVSSERITIQHCGWNHEPDGEAN